MNFLTYLVSSITNLDWLDLGRILGIELLDPKQKKQKKKNVFEESRY